MKSHRLSIANCVAIALLCASCASTPRQDREKKDPKELSEMYTALGTQALLRSEPTQAVTDLRKAISIDEKNPVAHNHLGLCYFALGKKVEAKTEIERAIEIDPNYSDAHVNLGRLAEEDQHYAEARAHYQKALDNLEYKTRHRALTSMAQLDIRENNTDEAKRLLYQSLQINPDYCLSHFLLGSLLMRESNAKRAAEEFKKSVASVCAGNVEGHYQLGLAYLKVKDFAKARAAFAYLVDQFPQSVEAQRAGEQLRNIP